MSDKNIRNGLRDLQAVGPEYAAQLLGFEETKRLSDFVGDVLRFAMHQKGECRHCYPRVWNKLDQQDAVREQNAIITVTGIAGVVISSCCKPGGVGHGWCGSRNWTETACGCECHCFVKMFYDPTLRND